MEDRDIKIAKLNNILPMGNLVWNGGWLGFPDILTQTWTTTLGNSNHGPMSPNCCRWPSCLALEAEQSEQLEQHAVKQDKFGLPLCWGFWIISIKMEIDFKLWAETQFKGQETDSQCHRQYISFKFVHYSIYSLARKNIWVNKEKIILLELQKTPRWSEISVETISTRGNKSVVLLRQMFFEAATKSSSTVMSSALSTFLFL